MRNYYGHPRFISLTWYCVWSFIIFIIQPKVKFKFCVNPLDANDIPITLMTLLTVKNKNSYRAVFYTMFHYVKINALCNLLLAQISKVEFLRIGCIIYKIQIQRKIKILGCNLNRRMKPRDQDKFCFVKNWYNNATWCIIFRVLRNLR